MKKRHHALALLGIVAGVSLAWHYQRSKPLALSGTSAAVWAIARKKLARTVECEAMTLCEELPMDAVERFVADLLAKLCKVTDPAKVAQIEAAAPKIVDGALAIIDVVKVVRGK